MYTEQDLVRVAKRENNNKRKYLVVNRLQGKHIPVKPHEALVMFKALADTLKDRYANERLLLVGFAETATAIGAAVASELGAEYMQTTRESVAEAEYLYFSEEHSHASEQKLVKNDIDRVIGTIDRIIFIEDEVTTGKTILNIISILKKQYSENIQFSAASILNGMDAEALDAYQEHGIELFWLVKTSHAAYTEIAESYKGDGRYFVCTQESALTNPTVPKSIISLKQIKINEMMNARRVVSSLEYKQFCESLYQNISRRIDLEGIQKILVLGTEEFMYPALYAADRFEAQGRDVRFHATTRSPIAVSGEEGCPLHTRYELKSLYDKRRTTFIYDLIKYDMVVIISDAQGDITEGLDSLIRALALCGNENIIFVGSQLRDCSEITCNRRTEAELLHECEQ